MMIAGCRQKEIGDRLGLSQQMVSYRQSVIRTKYPELLGVDDTKENTKIQKNFTNDTNTLQKNKSESDKSFVEETEETEVIYTKDFRF